MAETTLLAVAGAHLRGEPLNPVLMALGASFVRTTRTAPVYRMVALDPVPGRAGRPATPPRPGLIRCWAAGDAAGNAAADGAGRGAGDAAGVSVEVELYRLPVPALGALLLDLPPPLAIGTLLLADGVQVLGYVCEGWAARGAPDISTYGGWRRYRASPAPTSGT